MVVNNRLLMNCSCLMDVTFTQFFMYPLLKKAVQPSTLVSPYFPDLSDDLQIPMFVLDRHLHQYQDKMITQVLVQWSHCLWNFLLGKMRKHYSFLVLRLGDKPVLKKGGMLPPVYLPRWRHRLRRRALQEGVFFFQNQL